MWVLLVAVFVLWAPRRPRLAQVAFLLVAGFCVLGASFPPQASLWLLPLAVLAVPRWRDHLLWWGAEAAYFGAVWLYIAGQTNTDRALPPSCTRPSCSPARRRWRGWSCASSARCGARRTTPCAPPAVWTTHGR